MYTTQQPLVRRKRDILKKVSEISLLYYYLGEQIEIGKSILSPLRAEKRPSFLLYQSEDQIRYNDYGTGDFGDSWKLLGKLLHLSEKSLIAKIEKDIKKIATGVPNKHKTFPRFESRISIKKRGWHQEDFNYWNLKYYISQEILNRYEVIPVDFLWYNDVCIYGYVKHDPAYAFRLEPGIYKIYWPYNTAGQKWLSNCKAYHYLGFNQLPLNGDVLVITKALKEIMILAENNISAIAPQSESIGIPEDFITHLKSRFNRLFVMYDYDKAGEAGALKLIRQYPDIRNVLRSCLYDGSCKDFSDSCEKALKNKDYTRSIDLLKFYLYDN